MEGIGEQEPGRPWWRKKRWLAAGLLWLGLGYVLSEGPATYAVVRGWLPLTPKRSVYRPLDLTYGRVPPLAEARLAYRGWWNDLASRHRTRVSAVRGPGWEIVFSSDVDQEGNSLTGMPERDDFVARVEGRAVVVENGRRTSVGGRAWDGPVTLDGRPVAVLPKSTRRLSIGYFDGELSVEADGVEVETAE